MWGEGLVLLIYEGWNVGLNPRFKCFYLQRSINMALPVCLLILDFGSVISYLILACLGVWECNCIFSRKQKLLGSL